jgi:PAS domain S-box-containing protein
LEKSEKLFKSIAVNVPKSLILVIGRDHRFIAVEGDLMIKMGYNSRDYTGKHPAEVAPSERYEASKSLYDRVLTGDQFRVDRKGPGGEDYRVDFVPLKDEAGQIYAALIIALDITDIKSAEEKSAKLASIVESSDDAIISKTLDGIITSWNRAAERMYGYDADEMVGQSILKLIPEDRKDEEPMIIDQIKKGLRVTHFETRRVTRDGKELDVSLTISPIRDSNGEITGVSKIARDISEKKQDELRKSDFIGMVSHEFGDSDECDHSIPAQADHPFRAKLTRAFRGKLTTPNT